MAMILSPIVEACIGKLADLAAEKVGMILGVKDELMRLQRRMERLSYFLEDAEKKSIEDKSIRNWLGELKDVVYDADDILDLCKVHPTRLLEEDLDQQPPSTPGPSRPNLGEISGHTSTSTSFLRCSFLASNAYKSVLEVLSLCDIMLEAWAVAIAMQTTDRSAAVPALVLRLSNARSDTHKSWFQVLLLVVMMKFVSAWDRW